MKMDMVRLARLKRLPKKHRIAHVAALIRREGENSPREIALARLLHSYPSPREGLENRGRMTSR